MNRMLLPAIPGSVARLPMQVALTFARRFGASITVMLYQPRSDEHTVDPMSWGLTTFSSQESLIEGERERARSDIAHVCLV